MVELLPKVETEIKSANPVRGVLIGTLIMLSVILLGYCGMVGAEYYFSQKLQGMHEQLSDLDLQISGYAGLQQETNALQAKINSAEILYGQHIYWSPLFEKLERDTLPSITYLNFSADAKGAISLQAQAPDYKSISEQVAVLNAAKDWIITASVDNATLSKETATTGQTNANTNTSITPESVVGFTLVLNVDPNIFYPQNNARSENN